MSVSATSRSRLFSIAGKKLFAAAACAATLASCGGGGGSDGAPPAPPAATPGLFSVSGTVSATATAAVDSDTNDPLQQDRASNNTARAPQTLGNPAHVVGYVNKPNAGPDGPNRAAGDEWDLFRVQLTAGQVVELNFGDPGAADLDLHIADLDGNILAQSIGTARSECVRIGTTGTYLVSVFAYSGAATYEVSWGPVSLGTSCANSTLADAVEPAFVAGQMLAKPSGGAAGAAALEAGSLRATQLSVRSRTWSGGPLLLELPGNAATRAAAMRALGTAARNAATPHRAFGGASAQGALAFDTAVAIKRLRASGQYEYVEHNGIVQAQQVGYGAWPPNDALLPRMPHLDLIQLPDAYNLLDRLDPRPTFTPIVAVVDTGIVAEHPDLTRMLVPGFDFVSDVSNSGDGNGLDADPDDAKPAAPGASFHGTHVAGTIAAETFNGIGVPGVAPMARVMPIRVLGASGRGSYNDILQGVLFAAGVTNNSGTVPARRADVINLSLGGQGACPSAVRDGIAAARAAGTIVVAAAGNDGGKPVSTPANCPGAIAVSAIAYVGEIASYSNFGPEVVVTAPGGDLARTAITGPDAIWSAHAAFPTNSALRSPNYAGMNGTSMAAPHVAGVMALMRAVNPNISPAQIDALFANGALTHDVGAAGRDNFFGFGMINALKAVTAAGAAPPPPGAQPTLALSTNRLDFGSVQTQLSITLTRINNSTDSFARATDSALNPDAVTITPDANNPADGPYTLLVAVDRALLAQGENIIQVEITSAQNRTLRFDVVVAPRTQAPVGLQGVGPVYVLALDPATFATRAQANVITNSAAYAYTLSDLTQGVLIVAGTDTDNDGFICGAIEPCGAFPIRGAEMTVVSSNHNDVNFTLVQGGASAASTEASDDTNTPAPGFGRIR